MAIGTITIGGALAAAGKALGIGAAGAAGAGLIGKAVQGIKNEIRKEEFFSNDTSMAGAAEGAITGVKGNEDKENSSDWTTPKTPFTGWGNNEKEPAWLPSISDRTNDNIETAITGQSTQNILDWIEQQQKEQIALQEKWRQEEFARQDNAWQRAVDDMRKAGVNPNLVNAGPAESNSSTSQPAEKDYTIFSEYMGKLLDDLEREAEKGKVPAEILDSINDVIKTLGTLIVFAGKL